MALKKNKIKSALDIHSSIRRMAYQLYEANINETKLVLVGIEKKGAYLSKLIGLELCKISTIKLIYVILKLNKKKTSKHYRMFIANISNRKSFNCSY